MGWVREIRDLGKLKFLILADREGHIQVTVKRDVVGEKMLEEVGELTRESVVAVKGTVSSNPKAPGGVEVVPSEIRLINVSQAPLPLEVSGKTKAELPTRLNSRFLDIRRPEVSAVVKISSAVKMSFLRFFDEHGFINVNPPCIVAAATEGGTELFPLVYFDKEAFLSQSPQLYKQILMASGLDKVVIVTPVFRAEPHDTYRHLNEAVQMDIEVAFIRNEEDVLEYYDGVLERILKDLKERCSKELEFFRTPELKLPVKRITYERALELLSRDGIEIPWGEDFSPEAERKLCERYNPVLVKDWPTEVRSFYSMPDPERPEICRAFDLLLGGIEISSGAQRIHELPQLIDALKRKGLDPDKFEFYLNAFRYGMPPHGGWSIGLERFVMALLGLKNIREAALFPRDRRRLVP